MSLRILVVDDSTFYRNRIGEMLRVEPDLEVVGVASNGREAVEKTLELQPDVITMDVEMPVMDGIAAVREILRCSPVPILMLSSVTHQGAWATLEALDAGAMDFVPKVLNGKASDRQELALRLREKVRAIGRRSPRFRSAPIVQRHPSKASGRSARPSAAPGRFELVVIGASAGGPVAVRSLLVQLPEDFRLPVLVAQHMPVGFTGPFADRLDRACRVHVREAKDGDALAPGLVLVAPGGAQTRVRRIGQGLGVSVGPAEANRRYQPSVDVSFTSAAEVIGRRVLGVVLTGMGKDGRDGAGLLKKRGAEIWAQDEPSCVVYGMPRAVKEAGLTDYVMSLGEIGPQLIRA